MSFANPGSRQASSIGSLRRRLEPLPGNYVSSLWHMPRMATSQSYVAMSHSTTTVGAWGGQFWDNVSYRGAHVSGTITQNVPKTIVRISGASGVVGNIIFPAGELTGDVIDGSVIVDGREHRFSYTLIQGSNRVVFGPVMAPSGGDPWVTTTSNGNLPNNFSPWVSAGNNRIPFRNPSVAALMFPLPHLMALGLPVLYFKNSLQVSVTPKTRNITNSGALEDRCGLTYLLEPR